MKNIRIGIICPSDIAFRRFLPSLTGEKDFTYVGVAVADKSEWNGDVADEVIAKEIKKAEKFAETYGGNVYTGYKALIKSNDIDAIYLPLPPALHYKWAKLALEEGKHVFVEKPSTVSYETSKLLTALAKEKKLALHENYMFQYHSQITEIKKMIENGEIGKVHSYHAKFGFPMRAQNDFRYNKALGGGALLDAGGYVIKLATKLLGENLTMLASTMKEYNDMNVDMYGSYMFKNEKEEVFVGEYGMDCEYQCSLSVWGSKGILSTDRIFTAPDNLKPIVQVLHDGVTNKIELQADSHFKKSIRKFYEAVNNEIIREKIYQEIEKQAELVERARILSGR
ncbi:Gfo/Idh/MocA family protein [[Clostridium] innocuum]|uniref:Gfo/Idh/MocA family protein n=1 Tax=Clostridium innocuum TaxID=1522 RepID=UPI001AF940EF|nr:Gfo/Idh/MocA family oxidoreductase [[Clostridium] innocuum]QSI24321.1 gfo/Idh/MocA family oxidoreductase [Erysipelotrichaceae bacterium 66202529]MCC2832818.1 Gfo/Idh/MocA family oxidoreductase [[Clostridium] innocuum]MCR0248299.1 Gfo/Idh/MocA family oxidoreductase [[Clostridium] innocuum]MCR0260914.1 Gfo/Idh/MocA family oxidoreductase [[Clostridium] innocuum]MCR0392537.1 Gfo/Idh/MocA family oxidoreductase [[Clostridium] innocuum]